eukprot:scaffold58294_cov14-Tisochrysis_lutea.AAC.1
MNRLQQRIAMTPEQMNKFGQRFTITPERVRSIGQGWHTATQRMQHGMSLEQMSKLLFPIGTVVGVTLSGPCKTSQAPLGSLVILGSQVLLGYRVLGAEASAQRVGKKAQIRCLR